MRLLILGDVVGRSGRELVLRELPKLRERYDIDFAVVNGENSAGGFGISEGIFNQLRDAGADVVTTGNHVWDQREALVFIDREPNLLRPLNYPKGTPGKGAGVFTAKNNAQVLVINAMGRIYMDAMDDPFAAIDEELALCPLGEVCDAAIIDFHAEATSEKQAIGHYFDGRVSCVFGTHTHVPTADHQILGGGSAYMSDVGMCGDYDSIIGMDKDEPISRFVRKISTARFTPALGEATISGLAVEVNDKTGLADRVAAIRIGARLEPALPDFW